MEDHEIINLYYDRAQQAITETSRAKRPISGNENFLGQKTWAVVKPIIMKPTIMII